MGQLEVTELKNKAQQTNGLMVLNTIHSFCYKKRIFDDIDCLSLEHFARATRKNTQNYGHTERKQAR